MRTLLHDYPRDAWPDHPHFARSIQNWLGAHQMFRDLGNHIETQTQRILDKDIDEDRYLNTLNRYGTALIQNLHGHHSWEDQSYFPSSRGPILGLTGGWTYSKVITICLIKSLMTSRAHWCVRSM
jgi:hypothetical protein